MKEKTLHVLEYNKIIEMLREQAGSEMTKKVISELMPYLDASEIQGAPNGNHRSGKTHTT